MTSLTYASNDVTPIREGFWRIDGVATRPDSRWGIIDDKEKENKYMTLYWWYYKEWENAKKHPKKTQKNL